MWLHKNTQKNCTKKFPLTQLDFWLLILWISSKYFGFIIIFSGVFSVYFIWNKFLSSYFNFPFFSEIRWNSYLFLTYVVSKGCPCVGASLYSPLVPSGLLGIAGSDVNMSHISPHCMLAVITLVGAGAAGSRARARCARVFSLFSGGHQLMGQSWSPRCWSRSTEGRTWASFVPFKCVASLLSASAALSHKGAMLEQDGLVWASGLGLCALNRGYGSPSCSQSTRLLLMYCLCVYH